MRISLLSSPKWLVATLLVWGVASQVPSAYGAKNEPTHKQARSIAPMVDGRPVKLETFCVGPDNNLWMCCVGTAADKGLIMVYSGEGEMLHSFPLKFIPQALNFSPEGKLFVAGSGKIARMTLEGKLDLEVDAPNIGNKEEALAALKKENFSLLQTQARAMMKDSMGVFLYQAVGESSAEFGRHGYFVQPWVSVSPIAAHFHTVHLNPEFWVRREE